MKLDLSLTYLSVFQSYPLSPRKPCFSETKPEQGDNGCVVGFIFSKVLHGSQFLRLPEWKNPSTATLDEVTGSIGTAKMKSQSRGLIKQPRPSGSKLCSQPFPRTAKTCTQASKAVVLNIPKAVTL